MSDAAPRADGPRDAGSTATSARCAATGSSPIAGVDEAGRGACAGRSLVAAAAILPTATAASCRGLWPTRKLLTEEARERCYVQVVRRALSGRSSSSTPEECDRLGMHVANVEALRLARSARLELLDGPRTS